MGEWTKEPWRNSQGFGYIYGAYNSEILREPVVCRSADQYSIDNETFDRIVACVNAMQDIPDPVKFVEAAKAIRLMCSCERNGTTCLATIRAGWPLHSDYFCRACKAMDEFDKALADPPKEAT